MNDAAFNEARRPSAATRALSEYRVAMSAPDIQPEDSELVMRALHSNVLSGGPFLDMLEQDFAAYIGVDHAIAVANGTAGLHLSVCAAGFADGDEVITTPFSFIASSNCLLYERAVPVFVDIDDASFNLDPTRVEAAITERTRGVLAVHVFGQPCALDALVAICRARDLALIEDACEAVGAEYRGRKIGTFGKAAVFSFYPNKQMTLGEGAIVTTGDAGWASVLRSLRNQGRAAMGSRLEHDRLGYNYRLGEMNAALGVAQLRRIGSLLARRDAVAARYAALLGGICGVRLQGAIAPAVRPSWFAYVVRLAPEIDRDIVIAELERRRVPSRAYFPAIHLQPVYRKRFGFREGDFPIAERVAASTLALPFHANLSQGDSEYVAEALAAAIARAGA